MRKSKEGQAPKLRAVDSGKPESDSPFYPFCYKLCIIGKLVNLLSLIGLLKVNEIMNLYMTTLVLFCIRNVHCFCLDSTNNSLCDLEFTHSIIQVISHLDDRTSSVC